jgi:Ca2+-binding RTX toxin-like protein
MTSYSGGYAREGGELAIGGASVETPKVAHLAGGGFVFVWIDRTGAHAAVHGQLFDSSGAALGGEFAINATLATDAQEPAVTGLAGGGFAVAWNQSGGSGVGDGSGSSILMQAFDATGTKVGGETVVNTSAANDQHSPTLSGLADGGFAVTWADNNAPADGVKAQLFSASAAKQGGEIDVYDSNYHYASPDGVAALAGGGLVLVFNPTSSSDQELKAQIFAPDGTKIGGLVDIDATPTTSGNQSEGRVAALPGGGFVVAWTRSFNSSNDVFAQMFDSSGSPVGAQIAVSTGTIRYEYSPSVAVLPGGQFVISWHTDANGSGLDAQVLSQIFDASGARLGHEFAVDPNASALEYPTLAALDGGRFVAGYGAKAQIFAPADPAAISLSLSQASVAETAVSNTAAARLVVGGTSAVNLSYSYTLLADSSHGGFALDGNRLVVADNSRLDYEQSPTVGLTIRVTDDAGDVEDRQVSVALSDVQPEQRYDAGPESVVNSRTSGLQGDSHVAALASGGYVIVWSDIGGDSDSSNGVRAQLYDSAGNKVGGEIALNSHVAGSQMLPAVAALASGGFVATWSDSAGDGQLSGIRSQIFDSTGARVGAETTVNTNVVGNQAASDLTALAGGGYVITWHDDSGAGADPTRAVRAQMFDSAGTKVGGEFLVNTTTGGQQHDPAIASLANGGFVIAWTDESATGGDTSGSAIRAQLFDSAGATIGSELLVNTLTQGSQVFARVAVLSSGNFVISWDDGAGDVRAQLFDSGGSKVGSEFLVNTTVTGVQSGATVTALPNGGFAATWNDFSATGPDDDQSSVIGQFFDANGNKVGGEFLVNATTTGLQQNNAGLTALLSGTLVASWTDYHVDGDAMQRLLTPGADWIAGTAVGETLTGTAGKDQIDGFGGDDRLTGGAGNDTLAGGPGTDTVDYSAEAGSGGVIVNLSDADIAGAIGAHLARDSYGDLDSLGGIENVVSGGGDDRLYGDAAANRLESGGGNDLLDGGAGADTMIGGAGNDVYVVDNAGDVVTENAGEGTADEVRTALTGYVLPANVEILTWIGAGAGDLRGNGLDNVLNGGTAGDFVRAQDGGDDIVNLGAGNDAVYFGSAYTAGDSVDGGSGSDQVALQGDYSGGVTLGVMTGVETLVAMTHSDARFGGGSASLFSYNIVAPDSTVAAGTQLLVNASTLQAGENLTFDGSAETNGSFFIYGGKGVDTLTGGSGADVFFFAEDGRFAATDHIDGGAGQDVMVLRGNYSLTLSGTSIVNVETVVLNSGSDARFYAAGTPFSYDITTADDTVAAGATMTFNGGALSAAETLHFDGSAETNGNFRLFGGSADDVIKGGAGNDLIYGGLGHDDLTGGAGADTFRYQGTGESTTTATDRILDFATGDIIDLGRIDAVPGGGDDAFNLVAAFDGHAGQLVLTQGANNVWTVSGDTDGNGQADFQILVTVSDGHQLGNADFVL